MDSARAVPPGPHRKPVCTSSSTNQHPQFFAELRDAAHEGHCTCRGRGRRCCSSRRSRKRSRPSVRGSGARRPRLAWGRISRSSLAVGATPDANGTGIDTGLFSLGPRLQRVAMHQRHRALHTPVVGAVHRALELHHQAPLRVCAAESDGGGGGLGAGVKEDDGLVLRREPAQQVDQLHFDRMEVAIAQRGVRAGISPSPPPQGGCGRAGPGCRSRGTGRGTRCHPRPEGWHRSPVRSPAGAGWRGRARALHCSHFATISCSTRALDLGCLAISVAITSMPMGDAITSCMSVISCGPIIWPPGDGLHYGVSRGGASASDSS